MRISNISLTFVLGVFLSAIPFLHLKGAGAPGWVKQAIERSDTIEIAKDAPAFIICNDYDVYISSHNKSKTRVRYAVKIISSLGTEHGILNDYIHSAREIEDIEGYRISPNGETEKLNRENIYTTNLGEAAGYYDDVSHLVASFPDMSAGDIIAYEYEIKEDEYWCSYYHLFVVQLKLPVLSTNIELEIPEDWILMKTVQNIDSISETVDGNKYFWHKGFTPYCPEESYMPDWSEAMSAIYISCYDPVDARHRTFTGWQPISRWTHDLFIKPTQPDSLILQKLEEIRQGTSSSAEFISSIADYVRDQIRYVAVAIDEGRFTPRFCSQTASNHYGDCKDKSALMVAMLKASGFNASPVLVAVNSEVDTGLYTPFQFNHAIVGLEADSSIKSMQTEFCSVGDWLFFDPTDPATPLGELPEVLYGTWALRASRPGSELIKLPSIEPENYYRKYHADAVLDSNGSFSAHVTIKDFDLKSSQAEYLLKSSAINELSKRYQKYFASTVHNARIECLHYECFDDSTLLSFTLKGDNQTTSAGGIIMLKPDFFHTLDNPEDMDEKRHYPVTFGNPALYEKEIVWHLPENLVFEGILDSTESNCAIAGFKCDITTSDSTLRYFMKTRYLGGQVPAESYEDGYEFINDLNKSQNRIVIIKTR